MQQILSGLGGEGVENLGEVRILFFSLKQPAFYYNKEVIGFQLLFFITACRTLWKVVTSRFLNGRNNVDVSHSN